MTDFRNFYLLLSITVLILIGGCSTPQPAAEETAGTDLSPSWYEQGTHFAANAATYLGYATALASDSSSAVRKVIKQAEAELITGLSRQLEDIRRSAARGSEGSDRLTSRSFIRALRNAETGLGTIIEIDRMSASVRKQYSGYRGFARATAARSAIVDELDRRLSSYSEAWSAMKNSAAFSRF